MLERRIGIIGLGRMGLRLARRLKDKKYDVVGFDISKSSRELLVQHGMEAVGSLAELCANLGNPNIIIIILPAGSPVEETIHLLTTLIKPNSYLLDFGNSNYLDSMRRSELLRANSIGFMDVGMSGGITGAQNGACLTIGGNEETFATLEYLFRDIAKENGYAFVGPAGYGHLVKTVHNGIEYGFLQAIAEGLHIIKAFAEQEGDSIDLKTVCSVWCNGSIIASRLMEDTVAALRVLEENNVSGIIGGGETGMWAKKLADAVGVHTPVLDAALESRRASTLAPTFSSKLIASIRNVFGEHDLCLQK
ncbi:MAG: NADP-dependent phosphogluconate dehydrogenase [Anaerolineaceae bacterium]